MRTPVKAGITSLWMLVSASVVSADMISFPVVSFSAQTGPVMINLGSGPVSTGPITLSLESGQKSVATFDVTNRLLEYDLHLELNFPLLGTLNSAKPTLEVQEIGPVTFGISQTTGKLGYDALLAGGGTIKPGTPFEGGIASIINFYEPVADLSRPPMPGDIALLPPPTPYPVPFNPFPPTTLPARLPLESGFNPASDQQVRSMLPGGELVAFSFNGIFRFPGQSGDIQIPGEGSLVLSIPEPGSMILLAIGILGLAVCECRRLQKAESGATGPT